ncbi:folylpolyglutamate synthase/dihydrofolate synthase family protein [Devosia sp. 63-57]|uniref:bifunctional folylpolyglutamate synthase/dihydrofolate synthase n=1 Tax=Devosia sp. 63-57 TaxID=1895751 RepID=UPI00086F8710|nr:folylpolyglutamate synthase/dihydrofolate synthase family protein [Devosia sp. 63-57]ODT48158.1 MAG: bifunctional folylpolyglutamate synthase/dihydrofolate synthase [Pelagibacterium sp. SCN 63-126]ODU85390.1 MAG: bifunctional folylpolyglutamate synthase/dihydrofolate synthase [Pelagibacterium sp. SCN 63-17]OJX42133.1 MAG: bifunctional folylpolyglutamate synthase/dihydrofolate synthase [Devosia sp. 63-57]
MSRTDAILKRLSGLHPKLIDLSLERILRLLADMGNPQQRLPPVIHVAGTNAKGSTIAYLRAFLEAAGQRVHVYNSPHLVRFNERIRLAGTLVGTRQLNAALEGVEHLNAGRSITFFEVTTATAFKLFAETPADFLLLETGMGGTYDTTNVVDQPLGTIITPVDLDHQAFLGNSIAEIAVSKAGILKRGAKAVIGLQQPEGRAVLERAAHRLGIRPLWQGEDFHGQVQDGRMVFQDEDGLLDLPPPALLGPHQFDNAALAIAATRHFGLPVDAAAIATGLRHVIWPARMMPLRSGKLRALLPADHELWLDGGHNAHGAAALARSIAALQDARPQKLIMIMGMINNRDPVAFLEPFRSFAPEIMTLTIPGEANAHKAAAMAGLLTEAGFTAHPKRSIASALSEAAQVPDARVLICGSLYLAGDVLAKNGTPPD